MPYCKECANTRLFGSSKVPPVAPTANGCVSAMLGHFREDGQIESISSVGADKKTLIAARVSPEEYFDLCLSCYSQEIVWTQQRE
ncbi:MAG: hypothetical protein H6Q75_262 [Firmicutes bacterium]|nr:hypothetical protein [Bacillota bacterium]